MFQLGLNADRAWATEAAVGGDISRRDVGTREGILVQGLAQCTIAWVVKIVMEVFRMLSTEQFLLVDVVGVSWQHHLKFKAWVRRGRIRGMCRYKCFLEERAVEVSPE